MKTLKLAAAVAFSLLMSASVALAAPVTWNVTGTLSGGGTVSGSFAYDSGSFSAVNIITTAGSQPGAAYIAVHPTVSAFPTRFVAVTSGGVVPGQPVLDLKFSTPLNNSGGVMAVNVEEGVCNADCSAFDGITRKGSGSVTSSLPVSVPAMSEWAMILLGVLLAGGAALNIQRRRTA